MDGVKSSKLNLKMRGASDRGDEDEPTVAWKRLPTFSPRSFFFFSISHFLFPLSLSFDVATAAPKSLGRRVLYLIFSVPHEGACL